jgi:hypothetical protein
MQSVIGVLSLGDFFFNFIDKMITLSCIKKVTLKDTKNEISLKNRSNIGELK